MGHLKFTKAKKLSTYQKIAIGTWKSCADPSTYSWIDIDYESSLALTRSIQNEKGIKLTPTYFVAQAHSLILTAYPRINAILRWGQLYHRESVNISVIASIPRTNDKTKHDLSACVVHDSSKLNILDLYEILNKKIKDARKNKDNTIKKQNNLFKRLPTLFVRFALNMSSFILYTLNLRPKGLPKDPFGAAMISNVGQFGADNALIPLIPYTKTPIFLAIGALKPRPYVTSQRELVVKDMLKLNYTMDHRYFGGQDFAVTQKMLIFIFQNPKRWLLKSPDEIKDEFKTEFFSSL